MFTPENIQNKHTRPRVAHIPSKTSLFQAGSKTDHFQKTQKWYGIRAGIGSGWISFSQGSSYGALGFICGWNGVGNTPVLCLLLNCASSQSAKGKLKAERGHEQDSCHMQTIPYKVMLWYKSSGERGGTIVVMELTMDAQTLLPRKQLDIWLHKLVN